MSEKVRLQDLNSYKILDTSPEQELDELAEIASAICDTPISLVSFIDEKRQWYKAKKGIQAQEVPIDYTFCQHALHNSKEVLVVDDPLHDNRFKDNPFVVGQPYIRFYAGAPLESLQGNVLGTLCVIDHKPHKITDSQKKALLLLAKKVMSYLETRKHLLEQEDKIELSAARLKKLTDQAPGAIFQLAMKPDGSMSFPFLSEGFANIFPNLDIEAFKEQPEIGFKVIHPDDLSLFQKGLQESFVKLTNLNVEYRIISKGSEIHWHWANAKPEKQEDGTVVWYGTFQDVTQKKEYVKTLEQVLFDISHTMRRPITTMLGLTATIEEFCLEKDTLMDYIKYIKKVAEEMDEYTQQLNEAYFKKRSRIVNCGENNTDQ